MIIHFSGLSDLKEGSSVISTNLYFQFKLNYSHPEVSKILRRIVRSVIAEGFSHNK